MNSGSSLSAAKKMLHGKRFQWAAAIFERIANENSEDSAEAAYCLGIMHHTGSGVPGNVDEAAKYYLIAARSGHPMATYRLGHIYQERGDLLNAYDSFRSTAESIPSAAYWAYRLLSTDGKLDSDPDASEKYVNSAAKQGHVRAQRVIAIRYLSGKEGLLKMPYGLALYARLAHDIVRVVIIKNEKMKYE
jgi:TPR repeat protein